MNGSPLRRWASTATETLAIYSGGQGVDGAVGPVGVVGTVGAVGMVGTVGPVGVVGAVGPVGVVGTVGAVGMVFGRRAAWISDPPA